MEKTNIEDFVKALLSESITILGEISKPKGERVAPRIYISTQHIEPKGLLKIHQKYKIIFIPILPQKENKKMDLLEYNEYIKKTYPGIKEVSMTDTCNKCESNLTLIEKISIDPQETKVIAFCAKCIQFYDCEYSGF